MIDPADPEYKTKAANRAILEMFAVMLLSMLITGWLLGKP
jgi:hypothetical protein